MSNTVMMVKSKKLGIKRINDATRKRNKRFQAKDRMTQRVMIAKDALLMLDMKKLQAKRGVYLFSDLRWPERDQLRGQSCAVQLAATEQCQVCGLGAVFAGAVRRGAIDCPDEFSLFNQSDHDMRDMLKPYFTIDELWSLENYFESGYTGSDDARLRAVLNTIIDSKGVKVYPPVEDEEYQ